MERALGDHGRLGDVLQGGEVREEVEVLEHHADFGALLQDVFLAELVQPPSADLVSHQCPVDGDVAAVDFFEVVDGAQQGGLARAGRANDHGHSARFDREGDALQDFGGAE